MLSAAPRTTPRSRLGALAALATVALTAGLVLTAAPALATAVPPTPSGFTAQIEAVQPYLGQSTCDPVAKPGVTAFRDLLLATYPDSGSLGIVQDCGVQGQSEHKEGRAFDWAVSVHNSNQVAEVNALLGWLTAADADGHPYAMARRLGIMYMIWDHRMWRAYDNGSWHPYSGVSAHTDHVHFSFGWNGAKKATSFWNHGVVAPLDYGPTGDAGTGGSATGGPTAEPTITPVRSAANVALLAAYGALTLQRGSTGAAVQTLQRGLGLSADGDYGPQTAASVASFQAAQDLAVTNAWGPLDWPTLFPLPILPLPAPGNAAIRSSYGALTLGQGAAGPAVRALQLALGITADGDFGPNTAAAVSSFQRAQNLAESGTWGPPEWRTMFPLPVPVTVDGAAVRTPPAGSAFTIAGTAGPDSTVTVHFHKAGTAAGDYTIARTATADAAGRWSRTFTASTDYRYYATAGYATSATVLNAPSATLDGPARRLLATRLLVTLGGAGTPGSTVTVHLHHAGHRAQDYGDLYTATVDRTGRWQWSGPVHGDLRVFVSRVGQDAGTASVLIQRD